MERHQEVVGPADPVVVLPVEPGDPRPGQTLVDADRAQAEVRRRGIVGQGPEDVHDGFQPGELDGVGLRRPVPIRVKGEHVEGEHVRARGPQGERGLEGNLHGRRRGAPRVDLGEPRADVALQPFGPAGLDVVRHQVATGDVRDVGPSFAHSCVERLGQQHAGLVVAPLGCQVEAQGDRGPDARAAVGRSVEDSGADPFGFDPGAGGSQSVCQLVPGAPVRVPGHLQTRRAAVERTRQTFPTVGVQVHQQLREDLDVRRLDAQAPDRVGALLDVLGRRRSVRQQIADDPVEVPDGGEHGVPVDVGPLGNPGQRRCEQSAVVR
jgi:hypothetical protein